MNRKLNLKLVLPTLLAALTGLASTSLADDPERPPGPVTGDNPNIGIKYDPDQGLNVTPFSAKLLGLKMAEVEEKEIVTTLTLQARIYDVAGGEAVASAWLPDTEAKQLEIGQEVKLERDYVGSIADVSAEMNGQAEVILTIADPSSGLKTGKFLEGTVTLPSDGEVVVVPKKAIIKSPDGAFAYVDNAGWTIRTEVELGVQDDEFVEVIDGVYYGDVVVTSPVMALWMTELQLLKSGKA